MGVQRPRRKHFFQPDRSGKNTNIWIDTSWASIDADLLNTSWDMLLRDVKNYEMYKIINIAWKFAKNMFCQRKVQENNKYPETEGL